MGARHSASEAHFIDTTISQAMSDAGVAHDSTLKPLLVRDAEISTAGSTAAVRIVNDGRTLSIEERLAELKASPMFRHHFPKGSPTVPANDMAATRANFSEIAAGRIKVV